MLSRRDLLIAGAAGCVGLSRSGSALAQRYPDRPIKLIVPFPPGGPTDVMARLVAQRVSSTLGNMVVENRPGAGGTIGARMVANADADGYTLLFGGTSTLAINPAVYKDLSYDPATAFAPVATVSTSPFILVVHPSLSINTLKELIAYARANPGKLNFGSAGIGTTPHMTGELFKSLTGLDIVHVPYKGGAPVLTDLVAGQIQMTFELKAVLLPLIRAGKLRALAVATETRSLELPEIPTMAEGGVPGCLASSWFGVVAPAGTRPQIVATLNSEINNGLKSAEVIASLANLGSEPKIGSPAEFAALVATELQRWSSIAKTALAKVN
jgi:tripartite-type tricarboxylate transporter receptor subunit TctC